MRRASSRAIFVTGKIEAHTADVVVLQWRLRQRLHLSTNAKGCNTTATWRSHQGAYFANPCFTQIHPTCILQSGDYQSKYYADELSLRNDGRVWVPEERRWICRSDPKTIPESDRDYYFGAPVSELRQSRAARHVLRRAKDMCDQGKGVGPEVAGIRRGRLPFSISRSASSASVAKVAERYDNPFQMYERITGENPYEVPMRMYPAIHYTMGGLWVDYNLMSTITGLFVGGEANFSDHGANRLGASALMQGLADGYFVLPVTVANYLAGVKPGGVDDSHPDVKRTVSEVEGHQAVPVDWRQAHAGVVPPRARHADVGLLRYGAPGGWPQVSRSARSPELQRAVLQRPERRRHWRRAGT